jgi:hypothetical protein
MPTTSPELNALLEVLVSKTTEMLETIDKRPVDTKKIQELKAVIKSTQIQINILKSQNSQNKHY